MEVSIETWVEKEWKFTINFSFKVKPGDANQKQLPHIPTNLDELKDCMSHLGSSAYNAVFGDKTK